MMDPSSLPCPAIETIRLYAAGGFDEERAAQLETHLLTCSQCETLLDGFDDPSDAVIQALASLPTSPDDEIDFQQLRETAEAMRVEFADAAEATNLLQRAGRLADPALGPLPCQLGNYELRVCIGRGASGAVFRARHLKLDQKVAVKVLDASRSFAADAFLQEMKTIGSLAHPHIVRATDAGEVDGLHYLVMEYVDGIDAARLLFRNGPLRVADACEIARQAALGLQFVHQRSLVHRDIKPSNLLVTVDGQVKLLDLGIATRSDEQTLPSKPQGTFDYMPPEQWDNSTAVDARCDLYSLGCTLFKLLSGSMPPKPAASVSKFRSEVPRVVDRLLQRMLATNPNDRPSSVIEVHESLRTHTRGADLRGLVATVYPNGATAEQTVMATPRRFSRRQALTAALATTGTAALLFPRLRFGSSPHLRRTHWRELTPLAPELLLALGDSETVRYSTTEDGEININSEDLALIHLGRPVTGLFTFEVHMLPGDWQHCGVFFHGQIRYTDKGRVLRFHTVELKTYDSSAVKIKQYSLLWNQWTAERDEKQYIAQQTPLAEVPVELAANPMGQQLQVTCGRQGMPEIAWNGKKLHESMWQLSLEARDLQRMSVAQLPTAFLGRLGLLNTQGSATFVQPRLTYL